MLFPPSTDGTAVSWAWGTFARLPPSCPGLDLVERASGSLWIGGTEASPTDGGQGIARVCSRGRPRSAKLVVVARLTRV